MIVQKENVQYRIDDADKAHYLEMGFAVLDENGAVIESKTHESVEALKAEIEKLKAENEALKAKKAKE